VLPDEQVRSQRGHDHEVQQRARRTCRDGGTHIQFERRAGGSGLSDRDSRLPLTKLCDEARLTPRQRLELFVPICRAVQHAHQKGIVHRDLKPANILVTLVDGKPVPRVIDFGVAKATAGKLTDESMNTHFGAVVGTLEYMAPEQAGLAGEDIDTRADIYSLEVILYELLTGLIVRAKATGHPTDRAALRPASIPNQR
jgi:serine/threonine protein kinase